MVLFPTRAAAHVGGDYSAMLKEHLGVETPIAETIEKEFNPRYPKKEPRERRYPEGWWTKDIHQNQPGWDYNSDENST